MLGFLNQRWAVTLGASLFVAFVMLPSTGKSASMPGSSGVLYSASGGVDSYSNPLLDPGNAYALGYTVYAEDAIGASSIWKESRYGDPWKDLPYMEAQSPDKIEKTLGSLPWFDMHLEYRPDSSCGGCATQIAATGDGKANPFGIDVLLEDNVTVVGIHYGHAFVAYLFDAPITYFSIQGLEMGVSNSYAYDWPQVVPLPAALPLYGTGLAVMGFIGWRKRRKAAQA